MPPLGVKDLTMPAAAFTMAIVLSSHVYSSINQARQEAEFKRAQALELEHEKKLRRLSGGQNGASMDNQREN
ncbi:hypothetical protein J007_03856 [Cryptococcus neoformans]|nr:hypothetical protein C356_03913 [Cryptococcus neoformans var. grubii c45]OXB36407.1 hypothetical protein J007_03856 [Cryptococcus neoformans var. grubii]OXC60601.1 hypothetical protein C358_03951 [Cryptococcus neoformans var. grubii MW-RSA852]